MTLVVRNFGKAGAAALLGTVLAAWPFGMSSSYAQQSAPSLYNWNGFYLGAHAGWGFGSSSGTAHAINTTQSDQHVSNERIGSNGVIGGGQVGFNWMASPKLVLGIEADVSGADINGNTVGVSSGGTSFQKLNFDTVGTVRGRIGYPIMNNSLIYGTGGLAWGHANVTHIQGQCPAPHPDCVGDTVAFGATSNIAQNLIGWTAGAGVEVAVISNWTARLEYLHMGFGSYSYQDPTFGRSIAFQSNIEAVRLGVNYKFDR
jgi:outer membrane immunogenic protein